MHLAKRVFISMILLPFLCCTTSLLAEEKGMGVKAKAEQKKIARAEYQALKEQRLIEIIDLEKQRVVQQIEAERLKVQRLKQKAEAKPETESCITAHIDLSEQSMRVFKGDDLLYKWRVSTARRGYVTPVGDYQPQFIERMHYSRLYHNSPMPYSIFFNGNYAIHGTNSIRRLGRRASHGCVRLHPKNAKKLYTLVRKFGKVNTFIKITH